MMIDHTTIQRFPVPPAMTVLQIQNSGLTAENKRLNGLLIVGGIVLVIGVWYFVINQDRFSWQPKKESDSHEGNFLLH